LSIYKHFILLLKDTLHTLLLILPERYIKDDPEWVTLLFNWMYEPIIAQPQMNR